MKIKSSFHPRLIGFAGFSGSGKTTLIEKLITQLSHHFKIGYIKHDAHLFNMDHEGKDTYRQFQAGAQIAFINDSTHFSLQVKGESYTLEKEYFKDCDFVFIEGHKYSEHPKILFLDSEGEALKEFKAGKITGVIATVSTSNNSGIDLLPHFHRDQTQNLCDFIFNRFNQLNLKTNLSALILMGGKSTRMGHDKYNINYHGKNQVEYLTDLFNELNIPSFVSCRQEQLSDSNLQKFNLFPDRFIDFGPLGGILTAMTNQPNQAWIVVACDLPFIEQSAIKNLMEHRNPFKQATAYFNHERKQYEPLFAIYEPSIYSRMLHFLGEGMTCPQKVLFNSSIEQLELKKKGFIENVNTPEEMEQAKILLRSQQ